MAMQWSLGGWNLIELRDFDDPNWSYEYVYSHHDSRKAVVGPGGYCSDPDLGWLLCQRERRKKRQSQINAALSTALNAPMLLVAIQAIWTSGLRGLPTIAGYAICSCAAFGSWNAILLRSVHDGFKGRLQILVLCIPLFILGGLLISHGQANQPKLSNAAFALLALSVTMGLLGSAKLTWLNRSDHLAY